MLLDASSVGMTFGDEDVFEGLTFRINRGDRTALVGVNGAGKTTLFRLLTGELDPTAGTIHTARSLRVAHLPQLMGNLGEGPLLETVCREAGEGARALDRMEEIHGELPDAEGEERRELMRELSRVGDVVASWDAFRMESRAERILAGLGFRRPDMERPVSELSGGWRMRARLASLLLADPDLLLLDEPTNHLDLDARLWLEEYLAGFAGAVWVISHDPAFLDRIATRIAELEFGELTMFTGNYSDYERRKAEETALREKQARQQAARVEKLERFIRRWGAKESKRFQVRSRQKMLERMEVIRTHRDPSHVAFSFPDPPRSGELVAKLSGVTKAYDGPVLEGVDLELGRGDRVGVVGRNGEGKSTLSRMLVGIEGPTSGSMTMGTGVEVGYFSQEADTLPDRSLTVLEHLSRMSPGRSEQELRGLLGSFLFTGDDVFKPTGVLSGGERSRLALAGLLLSPVNLLVLDEPTNHLDIFSRNVLQESLQSYTGTLVLVSHDEKLLDAVVEVVWEVGGGGVNRFAGDFSTYLRRRQRTVRELLESDRREGQRRRSQSPPREEERERKRREAAERKERYRKRSALQKRIDRVERKLLPLEEKQAELERLLGDPEVLSDGGRVRELQREHAYLSDEIAEYREQWDGLAEQMEDL